MTEKEWVLQEEFLGDSVGLGGLGGIPQMKQCSHQIWYVMKWKLVKRNVVFKDKDFREAEENWREQKSPNMACFVEGTDERFNLRPQGPVTDNFGISENWDSSLHIKWILMRTKSCYSILLQLRQTCSVHESRKISLGENYLSLKHSFMTDTMSNLKENQLS